jgi:hypothetical protein
LCPQIANIFSTNALATPNKFGGLSQLGAQINRCSVIVGVVRGLFRFAYTRGGYSKPVNGRPRISLCKRREFAPPLLIKTLPKTKFEM